MTESFVNILLGLSTQAVIMGGVIIILQMLLRKNIPPKFNFLLWLLVFAKLMIPINFHSVFSVFQIFKQNEVMDGFISNRASDSFSQISFQAKPVGAAYVTTAAEASQASFNIYNLLFTAWLAVAVALLFVVFQYYYSVKINLYRNQKAVFDSDIMELADICFDAVGVPRETEIICSSYANSPFVFGLFKPLIVIPYNLFEAISKDELRIIIMHEAIHIKRNHYRIKFLITFINIIHWYNPIAWYFSRLINKEMEFDCDYALLKGAWQIHEVNYAETLLNVAKFQKNKFTVGLAFGETNFLKRVAAIMQNKKFSNVLSIISLTLVIALSVGFFTLAKENKEINELIQHETAASSENIEASSRATSTANANTTYTADTVEGPVALSLSQSDGAEYVEILNSINDFGKDTAVPYSVSDNGDFWNSGVINTDKFWINYFQKNVTREELFTLLPYKFEACGNKKDIDNLKIDIDDCYVFIEYTNEEYIRMDFYSLGKEYIDAYKYGMTENGNTSTISVTRLKNDGHSPKDPKAVIIYIPVGINSFERVNTELSMCNTIVQGIKSKQLKMDISMSSIAIFDCDINDLIISSSMGTAEIAVNGLRIIDIDASLSTIDLSFDEIDVMDISSSLSNIDINCGKINEKADIEASLGNINLKFANEPDDLLIKGTCDMANDPFLPDGWVYSKKTGFTHTFGAGTKVMNIGFSMSNLKIE